MIKPKEILKRWQVPSAYQGTLGDNWMTQTITTITPQIRKLVKKIVKENI